MLCYLEATQLRELLKKYDHKLRRYKEQNYQLREALKVEREKIGLVLRMFEKLLGKSEDEMKDYSINEIMNTISTITEINLSHNILNGTSDKENDNLKNKFINIESIKSVSQKSTKNSTSELCKQGKIFEEEIIYSNTNTMKRVTTPEILEKLEKEIEGLSDSINTDSMIRKFSSLMSSEDYSSKNNSNKDETLNDGDSKCFIEADETEKTPTFDENNPKMAYFIEIPEKKKIQPGVKYKTINEYLQNCKSDFLKKSQERQSRIRQASQVRAQIAIEKRAAAVEVLFGKKSAKDVQSILEMDTANIKAFPEAWMKRVTKESLNRAGHYERLRRMQKREVEKCVNQFMGKVYCEIMTNEKMNVKNVVDSLIDQENLNDPFMELTSSKTPVFLLLNFDQILGPKPLIYFPDKVSIHLNLDNVSVWLMSADMIHGSTTLLFNQSLALHALVHYSTILDVTARAFQRSFALAYLTPERPSMELFIKFENTVNDMLKPVLSCNRRQFKRFSYLMMDIAERIENDTVNEYYKLHYSRNISPVLATKIQIISKQIRSLTNKLQGAFSALSGDEEGCNCNFLPQEMEKFFPAIERGLSSQDLLPLRELCLCAFDKFVFSFEKYYNELVSLNLENQKYGILFCGRNPVIRSVHPRKNYTRPDKDDDFLENEKTLCSMIIGLDRLIASLLSGFRICILASEKRERTALDFLQKLTYIKPSLSITREIPEVFAVDCAPYEKQIIGVACSKLESISFSDPRFTVILNLNQEKLSSPIYLGKFLSPLSNITNFPNDRVLIKFIASLISNICQTVNVARYLDPDEIQEKLELSKSDFRIVINLLAEINILKYGNLKQRFIENETINVTTINL
uniref:UDENN FLCN/SMCR8-type domain-containing protein n=1 Tax=Parastrongyloides trichosuri TaxID=131310 RepID=A0A0N4ZU07_PARTI